MSLCGIWHWRPELEDSNGALIVVTTWVCGTQQQFGCINLTFKSYADGSISEAMPI